MTGVRTTRFTARATPSSGRVVVWPKLHSAELGHARDIVVYLPPTLAATWKNGAEQTPTTTNGALRYPVLYFNDGQNVFDEKTAYVGEEWKADEALEAAVQGRHRGHRRRHPERPAGAHG